MREIHMQHLLIVFVTLLGISGCAKVPEAVKIALVKEGEAIRAIEKDYEKVIHTYHDETLKYAYQYIDNKLQHAMREELSQDERRALMEQHENNRNEVKQRLENKRDTFLNNRNMDILSALHSKIIQYASANKITVSELATIVSDISASVEQIKSGRDSGGGNDEETP